MPAMAGLYDGLEDVAFKRIAGGYVFQSNNPWLIGPRRRYVVNDAQKAEIAASIRETLRRIKPFVFVAMVLIPAVLTGSIFWFVTRGGTLNITVVESDGRTTAHSQPIGPDGSTGTLPGADGSKVIFHVSGRPGGGATVSFTGIAANGKAGAPCVVRFDPAGATVTFTDGNNHIVRSAKLVGGIGAPPRIVALFAGLMALALFGLYVTLIHLYSMSRLRPLLADLPPCNERITFYEGFARFGARMSTKLLVLMGFSAAMTFAGIMLNVTDALLSKRPIDNPLFIVATGASLLLIAQVVGLAIFKMRARQPVV
jgi:hypothetical protein